MKYLSLLFFIALFFVACDDEKIIDDTSDGWTALAAVQQPGPKLMLIEYPSGKIINADAYAAANERQISSAPRQMVNFGGFIFLLKPADFEIEVIDNKTYISKEKISFASDGKKPLAIAFAPNATAAYVIFRNDSTVDILDLTVMQVARTLKLPATASSISLNGNQIFVACPDINKVVVVDTRDNELKEEVNVPEVPVLLTHTNDGLKVVVVSAGKGKYNEEDEKTDAYVSLLDAGTKKEIKRQPLGIGIVKPKEQIPYALAAAGRLYAFIGTQEYLLQFNTRTAAVPARIKNGKFVSVLFNDRRAEMLFIRDDGTSRQLITYNPEDKKTILDIKLPEGVISLLPK
jgi:hypothetical protein